METKDAIDPAEICDKFFGLSRKHRFKIEFFIIDIMKNRIR